MSNFSYQNGYFEDNNEGPLLHRIPEDILQMVNSDWKSWVALHDTDYDDYDDDDDDNEPTPSSTVPRSALGGKKAMALDELARDIIYATKLKVAESGQLYRYDSEQGCYHCEHNPEKMISEYLEPSGHFSRLSSKDLREIAQRLTLYPHIQCEGDSFNCYPHIINTASGLLDYIKQEVDPHSPEYLFTYAVAAEYLFDETDIYCPTFEKFCQTSLAPVHMDDAAKVKEVIEQKRLFLLQMIGYACCDSNAGKCALFFKGEPDSGKSVMSNFITKLFRPELVSNIPLHDLSGRFNKAELFGKKLNIAGEIKGKKLTDISTFKSITGNDKIAAEFKGKDPFSFTPRCKMVFAGNALPGTTESDGTAAFTNRLMVLLFNHSVPKEEQDKELLDKLWQERNSIFTLAMQALRDLDIRDFRFSVPEESTQFVQSFTGRNNSLQNFVKECCCLSEEQRIHNVLLVAAYEEYCATNGLEVFSKQKLYEMLDGIPGVTPKKFRAGGENRWGRSGIGLKEQC